MVFKRDKNAWKRAFNAIFKRFKLRIFTSMKRVKAYTFKCVFLFSGIYSLIFAKHLKKINSNKEGKFKFFSVYLYVF